MYPSNGSLGSALTKKNVGTQGRGGEDWSTEVASTNLAARSWPSASRWTNTATKVSRSNASMPRSLDELTTRRPRGASRGSIHVEFAVPSSTTSTLGSVASLMELEEFAAPSRAGGS